MSRDFDELLRTWSDEGEEIFPSYYLDTTLRQVAATPQRSVRWAGLRRNPIMAPIIRAFERPLPRFGLLAVAATAVLAVGIGLVFQAAPNIGRPVTPALFASQHVDEIVLGEADAPAGSSYLGNDLGRAVLTEPVFYLDAAERRQWRALPGYVYARRTSFGRALPGPSFRSLAILFEDSDSAAAAMDRYEAEFVTGWGFANSAAVDPGLGDESLLFTGPAVVRHDERPGFYYTWRRGNLLLMAFGVASMRGGDLDEVGAAVLSMTEEMDERARQAASED